MATKIKIKRSTTAVPSSLDAGELAYTSAGDVLYIGNTNNDSTVIPIGGKRNPGVLTANQALIANSSSAIDKIIVANAAITAIEANGAVGTAGKVLTSNSSGGLYWGSSLVGSSSDTQILFNDGGGLSGDSGLTFNKTTDTLSANTFLATSTVNGAILQTGSTNFKANTTAVYIGESLKLYANGSTGTANQVLRTDSSGVPYWSDDTGDISGVTAGDGLTGGGTNGTVTIDVGAGNGIEVNATSVAVKAGNNQLVSNATGLWIDQSKIDHDSLSNFVSNEHVDHTSVSISTGDGLTGGGDISATRTLSVVANNGIVSNSSGVWAKSANGITVDGSGINVTVTDPLVSNASGVHLKTGSTLTVNTNGLHVNNTLSITDLTLAGNLVINGTLTTVDTNNLVVNDSIIELARNNGADSLDIGFYGKYVESATDKFTGLIWDTSADVYELFYNTEVEPTTTINTGGTGYTRATLRSYLNTGALIANSTAVNITANASVAVAIVANTLSLSTPLPATSGGTGFNTTAVGDLLVGTTGNAYLKLTVDATSGKILQSNGTTVVYGDVDGGTF